MRRGSRGRLELARGVEQPFGRELALQLLEAPAQQPFARFLDVLDDQLVLAARLVQAHAAAHEDLLAVRELERQAARCSCGTSRSALGPARP